MKWLKDKLKEWLFSKEIAQIEYLYGAFEDVSDRMKVASMQLCNAEKELNECRMMLTQLCDVGVDVGFHGEEHSWAVICVAGRPEYVKFLPLSGDSTKEIISFLKRFQGSHQIIDSPIAFRRMVDDRFWLK